MLFEIMTDQALCVHVQWINGQWSVLQFVSVGIESAMMKLTVPSFVSDDASGRVNSSKGHILMFECALALANPILDEQYSQWVEVCQ